MARNLPTTQATTRVVYYVDPVPDRGALTHPTERQLVARREAQRLAYLRWKARQDEIAQHDRRVRRFLLGFGAVTGLAVVGGVVLAGWLLVHALAGLGVLLLPLAVVVGCGLVFGGHRCITIVQHWH